MHSIQNNPYRIVGLLVGATAREQERQIKRLRQFIEAEQAPQDDFSFPTLGHLHRTIESVTEAAAKISLDSDKMNAALFWFYNGNAITDEVAFEAIKDEDIDTAIEIWKKLAYDSKHESYNEVTKRNASAFHNLSTLYLQKYQIDKDTLQLKLRFLESDFFNELKNKATDETYKISKKEMQLLFLDSLTHQESLDTSIFMEAIADIEFSAKDDFLKRFIQIPIQQIEEKVEETKNKRKANKANALTIGKNLYKQTSEGLKQLKSTLGKSNLNISSISDKVADEILQCGIDYFSHYKDSSTDPGSTSMDLFRKAKTLAVGSIAKQRCQENIENLQEWIDDKPERDKQARIKSDVESLIDTFLEFDSKNETIENAELLINRCKPKLSKIKTVLGSSDELYLKLSTRVANQAQNYIVEEVNNSQNVPSSNNYSRELALLLVVNRLKEILLKAWDVTNMIGTLDLEYDFKMNKYEPNKKTLKEMCTNYDVDVTTPKERLKKQLDVAHSEMAQIQEWQFLRSESEKQRQIKEQQKKISTIQELYNRVEY